MGDTQQRRKDSYVTAGPSSSAGDLGRDDGDGSEQAPKRARRTFLTQNACTRCRQKKSKCDGVRPSCARCAKQGLVCEYDVAQEGLTRMQNLQQQLETRTDDYNKMRTVFDSLQQGSDHDSTSILARLRLGADVDELLQYTGSTQGSSSRMVDGVSKSYEQHPQQLQQAEHPQGWSQGPQIDGESWNPWQGSSSHSVERSPEFTRDGARSDFPMRDYDDPDAPHDPYYQFAVPDGVTPQTEDTYASSMRWHEQDTMPPSNIPGNQYARSDQMPDGLSQSGPRTRGQGRGQQSDRSHRQRR